VRGVLICLVSKAKALSQIKFQYLGVDKKQPSSQGIFPAWGRGRKMSSFPAPPSSQEKGPGNEVGQKKKKKEKKLPESPMSKSPL